jgi:exopolysaccharide biosynthesis polyprenyl glycosylphosphotransferase
MPGGAAGGSGMGVDAAGGATLTEPRVVAPDRGLFTGDRRRWSRRSRLVRRALLGADAGAVIGACAAAAALLHPSGERHAFSLCIAVPLFVLGGYVAGLYDGDQDRPDHSTIDEVPASAIVATVAMWMTLVVLQPFSPPRTDVVVLAWMLAILFGVAARAIVRRALRRHPLYLQNTIILGAGDVGQLVGRKLLQHPEFNFRLLGFVDAHPKDLRHDLLPLRVVGAHEDLDDIVDRFEVDRAIVAFSNESPHDLVEVVRRLRELDVKIDVVPRLFEAVGPRTAFHQVEGFPLFDVSGTRVSRTAVAFKRVSDVVVASVVLLLTAPLFVMVAILIHRESEGPVFFRQERLGKGRRPFSLLKFRSMRTAADDAPHREYVRGIMSANAVLPGANALYKLDRSSEITRIGAWLRRTSLDELPQLINVLRGDMSLVGPRPCIAYETDLFEPHHFDRFLVPAGMTGLWQVAARAHATMKEALDLDASYARNWSLRLDLWLLARTPLALLRGGGTV